MATRITTQFEDEEPLELTQPIDELAELGVDGGDTDAGDDTEADDGDVEITIEGEDAPIAPAVGESSVINTLRKRTREQAKELAAYRATQAAPQEQGLPPIPPAPTLAAFDYDEDAFAAAVDQRAELVAAHKLADARRQQQQQAAIDAYNTELAGYEAKKKALKVPDFDIAEDEIRERLSQVQQTVMVRYSANPALAVYALGKRPDKLAALAKIDDPVRFALALADFEKGIKMQPRKPVTQPETIVRGNAPSAPVGEDKMLAKLESDFDKGLIDRTPIVKHKAMMAARAARR